MITYTEYELLCRVVDEHIAGRTQMLKIPVNDLLASISFLTPGVDDDALEDHMNDTLENAVADIKKLEAIKPKLLSLIAN